MTVRPILALIAILVPAVALADITGPARMIDGDTIEFQGQRIRLHGIDAPERVTFNDLRASGWGHLWTRIGRDIADVTDACENAMLLGDHHEWVRFAANRLMIGGGTLWQAMCAEWADAKPRQDIQYICDAIEDAIG